jgi:pyrroline-5-carboxylate reductase
MHTSVFSHVRKLAFIGGGNMATALISGLRARGLPAASMVVADPDAGSRRRLAADFGIAGADNALAVRDATVVILAVKPQFMRAAALHLAPHLPHERPLVISVAAGIPHAALCGWLGADTPVVRAMPNRPALHGCGATGLYAPPAVGSARRELAGSIMDAVGTTVWVEQESQLDTVTALSGSGPAYFFLLMEALETAAQAHGLPAEVAHQLSVETAYGAAYMARHAHEPLATLRDQVTSKGGTTAAALEVFEAAGFRAIVAGALAAADRRAAELAAQFAGP